MSCQNQNLRLGGANAGKTLGGNKGGIGVGEIAIPASFFIAKRLYTRRKNSASKYARVHKYKKSRHTGRRSRRY